MRLFAALALFVCSLSSAHALEPAATPTSIVHVGISDSGEYMLAVSHDGQPSQLYVRAGLDLLDLRLRFVAGNLHCTIKRVGSHPFEIDGDVEQSRGRAVTIGRFPGDKGPVDIKVRVTDGFNG